jgi:HK97 family phage portal protein
LDATNINPERINYMRFFPKLLSRGAGTNKREKRDALEMAGIGLSSQAAIWEWLDGGGIRANAAGELVNDWTATSIATVYTCTRILADAISALPCQVFVQTPTGKQLDVDNWLLHLLTVEANPETSAFSFFETLLIHLNLRGNAYAEIQRNLAGDVVALWNLDPRLTEPVRVGPQGDLAYRTRDGEQAGQSRIVAAKDMLHVTLFSWNGIVGQSPVAMLRETLGLAIAQQNYQARTVVNSGVPAIAIHSPGKVAPEDKTKMRQDWHTLQTGHNQGRVAILDNGYTIEKLGLSVEDSELLASRQFSRTEIAASFRVPNYMVGDSTRLSNGNAEQLALQFVQDALQPILKRIEIEFKRKLLPPGLNGKPNTTLIAFDLRERLRGDFASTMTAYGAGRQWGFYSVNDVRRELGEDTIGPEGDIYLVPVNMQNSARLLDTESIQDQPVGETAPAPDAAVRNILATSTTHYLRLCRDVVGRLAARPADKRTDDTVTRLFEPLAASVADLATDSARASTNAPEWQPEPSKAITEYLTKLTERSSKWNVDDLDAIAAQELHKLTKTLTLNAHRSIAEHVALKGLSNA